MGEDFFSLRVCKLKVSIWAAAGVVDSCRGRSRLESTPRFVCHPQCSDLPVLLLSLAGNDARVRFLT